jgi:hypothetical protein
MRDNLVCMALVDHVFRFDTFFLGHRGRTTINLSMKDRVAVVKGGSEGIGIAVARRFASRVCKGGDLRTRGSRSEDRALA